MSKRFVIPIVVIVVLLAIIAIAINIHMWINGTPWDKKEAEEKYSAVLKEHFGDELKLDKVVYSWKAEQYEAYAIDVKTQNEYKVICVGMNKGECFYTDMSTGKKYIMPMETAYKYAKNSFLQGEIYYSNFINCIKNYDDIVLISKTLQDNSYICSKVGNYYCYSRTELDFDDKSADTIIAFMQKTQSESVELYDTHIQVLFDYEGALYCKSLVYYYNADNKADIGQVLFEENLADNWYYVVQ